MMTDSHLSPGEGRHVCRLFIATLADGTPVRNGELADRLGVDPATVTETVKRFDDAGLARHEPYTGTKLTDRGEQIARRLVWRRCLVQQFFETTAGLSFTDDDAFWVASVVSPDQFNGLDEHLSRPCDDRCVATSLTDCDRLSG
ncbi:metal-dependent transcriptional regulator [Halobaculum sp. MBLA0147]|uniref:metal-dependent transcriptional regulator n=1 Tax=Halobaculum sp. MBLA0147 TaxID=3079934 RepID=UPI0035238230